MHTILSKVLLSTMFLMGLFSAETWAEDLTATVKADLLRVRSAPSTNAEIVANLPTGASVQIIDSPKDAYPWVKIRIPSGGVTGWVHGDYLIFGNGGQTPVNKNGLQFARISIWTGDPRSARLAEPGKPEPCKFYGVHGRFSVGTSFSVLAKDQERIFAATAKQTINVEFFPGTDPRPVTEVVFDGEGCRNVEPFLAVIGSNIDYKPLRLAEVMDSGQVAELTARVTREVPDFMKLPYDYKNSGFSSTETKASAFSLQLAGSPAYLVSYRTPYRPYDHPNGDNGFCQTGIVLWKGQPLNCSTDGGKGLQFFRIGKKEFCWHNYNSCNNGIRFVEVFELNSDKSISIYTNGDFAS